MIRLRDVHVVFALGTPLSKHALCGVDLDIADGEFVTVIGSNGAGKSTLLNVLAASTRPARGTVEIDGVECSRQSEHERATLVARVFQDPLAGTCSSLTVEENLMLAEKRGRPRGLRLAIRATSRLRIEAAVAHLGLGLEKHLDSELGTLSGGQRQAVSLLMASLAGSRLLLLDEHTAALDPQTAERVLALTRDVVQNGRLTTLMVTHSMQQALDYGTRTVMLDRGRIVMDIHGEKRQRLEVVDLLNLFKSVARSVDEDRLLMA
jgi:putative ABC transport system ATP-binding protein